MYRYVIMIILHAGLGQWIVIFVLFAPPRRAGFSAIPVHRV
jgi:hypothetical protein